MAWNDIVGRYRRSVIGPFWMTLSMAIFIGALGFIFSTIFRVNISEYLPFLALGYIFWSLIAGIVTESCTVFTSAESVIKQIKLPMSVYVYRLVWRSVLILCHNFVVFVPIALFFGIVPSPFVVLVLPGLFLIVVTGAWVGILLGIVCTRYRDLPLLVASLIQVAFFLTPIMWQPDRLGGHSWLVNFNPFFHYLDLVRAPFLGYEAQLSSWAVAFALTLLGWVATLFIYGRFRQRIVYWL